MNIDLQAIEEAFASIEDVLSTEETIEIEGTGVKVTLRPLSGREEIEVLERAITTLEGDRATRMATVDFFHSIHTSTLAYSIVQIGDMDLRDAVIVTGDHLPDGTPISRDKVDVVREFLTNRWSKPLVMKMFLKAVSVLEKLASTTAEKISTDPFDLDTEIARLEARLTELRKTKENKSATVSDWGDAIRSASTSYAKGGDIAEYVDVVEEGLLKTTTRSQDVQEEPETLEEEIASSPPPPPPPPPVESPRGRARPQVSAPPARPEPPPSPTMEEIRLQEQAGDHTFLDEGNPEESMQAEIRRQTQIRRALAERKRQENASRPTPQQDIRTNSLREAANLSNVVMDASKSKYQNEPPAASWGQTIDPSIIAAQSVVNMTEESPASSGTTPAPINQPASTWSRRDPRQPRGPKQGR